MTGSSPMRGRLAAAAVAALLAPAIAHAQLAVSANEHKLVWDGGTVRPAAGATPDTVTVIDLGVDPPKVIGEVVAPTTVAGPPTTVAVSPDESVALVTSGQKIDPADPTKTASDNRLTVVDLKARPIKVVTTLELGAGASGVSFNRAGDLALVANRDEGTVSVLAVKGATIRVLDKVTVGKPGSQPSHVAFTANDRMALVTRQADHQVTVLAVDGLNVKPTGRDISVGIQPYAIAAHPSGEFALVANVGRGSGDTDTLSMIDTRVNPPRTVNTYDIGVETPEGIVISPDGKWCAVVAHAGSTKPPNSPFARTNGRVLLYAIDGMRLTKVSEAPIGRWSQGAVFSRDSRTLMVGNMVEKNLMVFDLAGQRLVDTQRRVELKGGAAALRTAR